MAGAAGSWRAGVRSLLPGVPLSYYISRLFHFPSIRLNELLRHL